MQDRPGTHPGTTPDGGEPLVDALATYLKTSFVYPENNPRVRETVQALLERLAFASPGGGPIEFVLTRTGVRVAGREIDGARPLIAWLRERFVRARIHGVRIEPRPDPVALTAFAAGLRQCFPPGAPPLVEAWRHAGMGVEPLFAQNTPGPGSAAAMPSTAPTAAPPRPGGAARPVARSPSAGIPSAASPFPGGAPPLAAHAAHATPPAAVPSSPAVARGAFDGILALLTRSDRARSAIAQMHQRVEDEYRGAAHLDTSAMLEAVVAELAPALVARPDAACREVEAVLEALLSQIDGFLLARPDDPGTRMTHMAGTMTKRRAAAAASAAPQSGHAAPTPSLAPPSTPQSAQRGAAAAPPPPATGPAKAAPAPVSARAAFLDGLALPSVDGAGAAARPAPQLGAATPRPRLREDSFESFLEGVRTDVVARGTGAGANPRQRGPSSSSNARLEDGIEALLEDLKRLPHANDLELSADDPNFLDEALGACLQLLAYAADGAAIAAAIVQTATPIVTAASPTQRRILARWLRFAREGGPNGMQDDANQRVFEFLQRHGVAQMLSSREALDVDQVVQTFPTQFIAFLDGLDLKDQKSEETFAQLFEKVGAESVAEAARVLIEDGTLLTPHRTEKILKLGGRRAAAIARHYVATGATWTRALVVNFLRRQQLPRQEAAALSIVQPLTSFPNGYLADLCDCVAHGKANFKLHGYTSLLLRQYIRDTAENPGDLDRRLYAIRALVHWPTPETIQYLEQLAKEGRLLTQTKEARAVRQAATETLKAIRDSKEQA
ncbi:MAG: hypothetical protein IT457_12855 [Planctomycetes bacterium]|nr:hypothetical protein [Planctomycetota bacterium]